MKKHGLKAVGVALALMLMGGATMAEVRTTGDVWLRTGPGLNYDKAVSIGTGKSMEFLGESSVDDRGVTWYKVSFSGNTGWVSSRYSELIGEEAEGAAATPTPSPTPSPAPDAGRSAREAGSLFIESLGDQTPVPTSTPMTDPSSGRVVEMSGYYMDDLVDSANEIGLISYRQVQSEVPFQYYNDAVIVAGNQRVENIVVFGPGYEVYGVSVGMTLNAARACLNAAGLDYVETANGIVYEHKATEASVFTDANGHDGCVNVWVDENDIVTEIDWSSYTG